MLQQPKGDDFVIGTGASHSVRELCEEAFGHVVLDYREFVAIDPRYHRPTEVDCWRIHPRPRRSWAGSRARRSRS